MAEAPQLRSTARTASQQHPTPHSRPVQHQNTVNLHPPPKDYEQPQYNSLPRPSRVAGAEAGSNTTRRRPGRPGSPAIVTSTSAQSHDTHNDHNNHSTASPWHSTSQQQQQQQQQQQRQQPSNHLGFISDHRASSFSSMSSSTDTLTPSTNHRLNSASSDSQQMSRNGDDPAATPRANSDAALHYYDPLLGPAGPRALTAHRQSNQNIAESANSQRPFSGTRSPPPSKSLNAAVVEYEEEENERAARAMMQGLGLGADGSRSSSPSREEAHDHEREAGTGQSGRSSGESERLWNTGRDQSLLQQHHQRSLAPGSSSHHQHQSQQHQYITSYTVGSGSPRYFSPSTSASGTGSGPSSNRDSPLHQQQSLPSGSSTSLHSHHYPYPSSDRGDRGAGASSSSLGSAPGGVTSPLSPLVEPFSPATSASGASAAGTWNTGGLPGAGTGIGASHGSISHRDREPSNLDLQSGASSASGSSHQATHQQALPPLVPALPPLFLAQQHSAHVHALADPYAPGPTSPVLQSALGNAQGPFPPPQLQQHQRYGTSSTSVSSAPPAFLLSSDSPYAQQPSQFGSPYPVPHDNQLYTSTPAHPYSQPMSTSLSAASAARPSTSSPSTSSGGGGTILATDRAGYVRAGYAELSGAGTTSRTPGGVATLSGGGGGGAGSAVGMGFGPAVGPGAAMIMGDAVAGEEISTIFVVGFPEDMLEREFQNMFIFANGFQAATLKVPAATVVARERERERERDREQQRESAASTPGPNVGGGGGGSAAGGYGEGAAHAGSSSSSAHESVGGYDDAFYSSTAGSEPFSESQLQQQQQQQQPQQTSQSQQQLQQQRKQIIGFAKFATRAQALDARDILSGTRVDSEKGVVLKAEMAKKNLHTAAVTASAIAPGVATGSLVGSGGVRPRTTVESGELSATGIEAAAAGGAPGSSSRPAVIGGPLAGVDQVTLGRLAGSGTLSPAVLAELARQQNAAAAIAASGDRDRDRDSRAFEAFHSAGGEFEHSQQERQQQQPSQSQSQSDQHHDQSERSSRERSGGGPSAGSAGSLANPRERSVVSPEPSFGRGTSWQQHQQQQQQSFSHEGLRSPPPAVSSPPPQQSGAGANTSSSAIQQMAMPRIPLSQGSQNSAWSTQPNLSRTQQHLDDDPRSAAYEAPSGDDVMAAQQSQHYQPRNTGQTSYPYSAGGPPPRQAFGPGGATSSASPYFEAGASSMGSGFTGIPRTQNPADMNAPKNTLYVGGLPAVLPSLTGPFSAAHLEDSLRNAFSRCPGFRRLSFRAKSNGPIVFVEFDDVHYATRALQEMYGNTLGGMVKGGIRLSYSKNPLGVRSSSGHSSAVSHPQQGGYSGPSPLTSHFGGDVASQSQSGDMNGFRRPPDSVFGRSDQSMLQSDPSSSSSYRRLPPPPTFYGQGGPVSPPPISPASSTTPGTPFGTFSPFSS